MRALLVEKRAAIAEICRKHHVRRMAAFGSVVRDDFDPDRSDIDLAVEFETAQIDRYATNYFSLQQELADLFGRRVDLIVLEYISNRYLRSSILEEARDVYAA